MAYVGSPVRRREDRLLLTGQARFVDDIHLDGMLHLAFLRSHWAHARLGSVDTAAARDVPGVVAILTNDDLAGLPPMPDPIETSDYFRPQRWLLARETVRFTGEPVVAVVATSRASAEDACDAIQVTYEPLPVVNNLEAARAANVAVHDDCPSNVCYEREIGNAELADAFARAEVVIERRFRHPRHAAMSLEGRGIVAACDGDTGGLKIWASTQAPHTLQAVVAAMLELPRDQVRVMVASVGGGFGMKAHVFPEEVLVAWTARTLGRPVKWVADRREELLAATHAREIEVTARVAARRDGVLLALAAEIEGNVGAYGVYPYGVVLSPWSAAIVLPGPYRVPSFHVRVRGLATNTCPDGAYRGVGQPVAVMVHERMMDLIALATGLDPVEVRRRNVIRDDEFPYRSAAGMLYESGQYQRCLERAIEMIEYDQFREEQIAQRAQGRYLGIGIGMYVEYTGIGPETYRLRGNHAVPGNDAARLLLEPSGRVVVWTSLPAMGQGVETTFAQLVADGLDLPMEQVEVRQTDTAFAPVGSGCSASRSAIGGGGALFRACGALKERLLAAAAEQLEVSPGDLEINGGFVRVRGLPGKELSFGEIAQTATQADGGPGLTVAESYDPPPATFPNACHVITVEVDVETGEVKPRRYVAVEDCGPVINPLIVDGQTQGAVAQGLGGALFEELVYDEQGQLLTGTLMDYVLPGANEVPAVAIDHVVTPSPLVPGGFKGAAEGGLIGAVPALACAVADALAGLGVEPNELPLSPDRLRALLRAVGR